MRLIICVLFHELRYNVLKRVKYAGVNHIFVFIAVENLNGHHKSSLVCRDDILKQQFELNTA